MPSSSTSTASAQLSRSGASRSCRSTPKRRNWSAISRTPGEEWQPKGEPEEVKVHDFPDKKLGKAIPYGVYDLANNEGWVSVGIDHDTAQFAVAAFVAGGARWGRGVYPASEAIDDHGGRRRKQRQPQPAVEGGIAGPGRRLGLRFTCAISHRGPASGTRSNIGCSASSPRTGGAAVDQSRGDREPDREHDDEDGLDGSCRPGYRHV